MILHLAIGAVLGALLMAIAIDYRRRPRPSRLDLSFKRAKERTN